MNIGNGDSLGACLSAWEQRMQAALQALRMDQERIAVEQLRAALRTADAVEEIARQGVKLQEPIPAVWGP